MTEEQIVEETSTPVEETSTETPPDPNLGKWVWYSHPDQPGGATVMQAAKVMSVNPETGAFLLALPGIPPVEVAELPGEIPEANWPQLDRAASMFDQVFRVYRDLAAISPPGDVACDIGGLAQYIILRDMFRLLADIAGDQNRAIAKIGKQQEEIAKFLFAMVPKKELTIEEKAAALGIEVLPPPPPRAA